MLDQLQNQSQDFLLLEFQDVEDVLQKVRVLENLLFETDWVAVSQKDQNLKT